MKITLANVNYASKIKPARAKKAGLVFCLLSTFLLLGLLISPAAAAIDWKISPSNPTVGDTLKIKGTASPDEDLRAEVSFEKELPISEGRYQYLLEKIKVPKGKDNRFTVTAEGVENLNVSVNKFIWVNLSSEASEGIATISQGHVPPFTYKILIDGDALSTLSENSSVNLTVAASQTLTADSKGKFGFNYDTSTMPAGNYTIKIGDSEKTIELSPEKPVADFSASPTSGKAPLKVQFTDTSTGSPISWRWTFGDCTYSTQNNPVHTYDKPGKYTVSLTVNNAKGSSTKTMCEYISASKK